MAEKIRSTGGIYNMSINDKFDSEDITFYKYVGAFTIVIVIAVAVFL